MSLYKRTNFQHVLRVSDGGNIPLDADNRDYREYLAWVAVGNTPDPVDPPTAGELAVMAQAEKDRQDLLEAKAYAKLTTMSGMSPSQIKTDYTNNVKTTAQIIDSQATLAIAVALLARQLLKAP